MIELPRQSFTLPALICLEFQRYQMICISMNISASKKSQNLDFCKKKFSSGNSDHESFGGKRKRLARGAKDFEKCIKPSFLFGFYTNPVKSSSQTPMDFEHRMMQNSTRDNIICQRNLSWVWRIQGTTKQTSTHHWISINYRWFNTQNMIAMKYFATNGCDTGVLRPKLSSRTFLIGKDENWLS